MQWALKAQQLLAADWGVQADVWSVTSWNELRRDALGCDEWNFDHPEGDQRTPYVTTALGEQPGPVVAVSDWMRAVPDQIAQWVPGDFASLGTDGFGLSDTRPALRRHFRIDAESIVLRVLTSLVGRGDYDRDALQAAIEKYGVTDISQVEADHSGGLS